MISHSFFRRINPQNLFNVCYNNGLLPQKSSHAAQNAGFSGEAVTVVVVLGVFCPECTTVSRPKVCSSKITITSGIRSFPCLCLFQSIKIVPLQTSEVKVQLGHLPVPLVTEPKSMKQIKSSPLLAIRKDTIAFASNAAIMCESKLTVCDSRIKFRRTFNHFNPQVVPSKYDAKTFRFVFNIKTMLNAFSGSP
ncbi:hypothetical protein BDP27DRAFT_972904 [Rhodocollybia butyracea]|uniref:Uncharacterized protein n=1 Tax=Rhodocollybia butyracea TaxID=206335 RepID=A0A9P5PJY3_9AGAR|nr:hypothetical protein BDP27DRAFT_972904 [Rhodocollybia butyracea]